MAPSSSIGSSPFILLISFALLLSSSKTSLVSSTCDSGDKRVLLKIKEHFGNNTRLFDSWNPTTDCCRAWAWVECRATGDDDDTGRVMRIIISGGDLSGPIPPMFGDLPMLIELFIHDNPNLTGAIPPTLAKLTNLQTLSINDAGLLGTIPPFLCDLPSLRNLELSGNRLVGSIPGCFALDFDFLDVSRNRLTKISPFLGSVNFTGIILSQNYLTGDVLFLFGEHKRTKWMDLSRNELEFDLSEAAYPLRLATLDLSHNKISGRISNQVSKLGLLKEFDVSYNRLCGQIPTAGLIKQFNATSFAHNKCLCGGPLPRCARKTKTR